VPERGGGAIRSEKSAEAVVAAYKGRRAKREGELDVMSLEGARPQKPVNEKPGRTDRGDGEAGPEAGRDGVNHDILMDRLAKRISDKGILRLIRRYLQAGIMANGW